MPTNTMIRQAIHSAAQEQDITGLKLNTSQQWIYDTIQANPNTPIRVRYPRHDGARQVRWDETTQTPVIKHITPQEIYKDRE